MTLTSRDEAFKNSVEGKTLDEFSQYELITACSYNRYSLKEIRAVAESKGWGRIAAYADEYISRVMATGFFKDVP